MGRHRVPVDEHRLHHDRDTPETPIARLDECRAPSGYMFHSDTRL
ncbi:hypothetical protein BZL30_1814 [Mycobacterium kansasii]|uniref:Uncharacterized protein n=1 Tax=Mycobacterium kansasii TaxID=1768 RepID=A0A1V3XGH7_MYCKA|nr:hypothetical protein BZL30_1814 [Mycobacterium kansasii]